MRALAALAISLFAASAQASPSASWLELAYSETDIELADGDGYVLSGRWRWDDHWFLAGRYGESDFEIANPAPGRPATADWEYLRVGIGYRAPLSPQLEWFAVLSYDRVDLTVLEDEVESGENLEAGLAYDLSDRFNLGGSVEFAKNNTKEIKLFDEELGFVLRGSYHFSPRLGLVAAYEKVDRFDEWRVGLITTF